MAFMMPVMKNDYNIYASRSRTSSNNSVTNVNSRRHTQSESAPVSLSCSPGSDVEEHLAAVSLGSSPRRCSERMVEIPSKSASQNSLHNFHSKVVEKLRRKLRPKDNNEQRRGSSATASKS